MSRRLSAVQRAVMDEAVGTFALVVAGCGAIVINAQTGTVTHVGIAATFGLVIMVMIYALGHVSGAHFNPAVTLAFAAGRHFPWRSVPLYWAGQFGGALVASALLRELFGSTGNLGATVPAGSDRQSLMLELVLSFMLMLVITAVATDTRAVGQAAAIAIGATVGLDAMFGGPISGASMNPARSLAPALVSDTWQSQWIYVVGPALGALLGVGTYQALRGDAQVDAMDDAIRAGDIAEQTVPPDLVTNDPR